MASNDSPILLLNATAAIRLDISRSTFLAASTFSVAPPHDLDMPRELTVTFTQIQYTQTVLLNFAGLTWPHVSMNTLVPADDIIVPDSAWK
jgi:hypothetical protein